jgi:hypothetical protein
VFLLHNSLIKNIIFMSTDGNNFIAPANGLPGTDIPHNVDAVNTKELTQQALQTGQQAGLQAAEKGYCRAISKSSRNRSQSPTGRSRPRPSQRAFLPITTCH